LKNFKSELAIPFSDGSIQHNRNLPDNMSKPFNPVSELNAMLAETFGPGHHSSIARAPMFGHKDNCWIISGPKAKKAACILATKFRGKVEESRQEFLGVVRVSYSITF
jgi:hypothetical protein